MLGIVVVNHNTSALTLECLHSVADAAEPSVARVVVVDNGSTPAERQRLRSGLQAMSTPRPELEALPDNRGFAAACNHAIELLLADLGISHILLLNNDAVLLEGGLASLLQAAGADSAPDMLAARMHSAADPDRIDSLGIVMYTSALASARVDADERLLGPSGGLGLYSRRLLETLRDKHDMIFDERFFCYAEDIDLAMRARLLGFQCGYVDRCVALHHGQASSGGGFNDFVLYHGFRNSIWVIAKNFPMPWLLLLSPLIVALHGGIILRHCLRGRARVLWRLYRDAARGLPGMWRSRRAIQRSRTLSLRDFLRVLAPRIYDRAYLRGAWRELWHRPKGST